VGKWKKKGKRKKNSLSWSTRGAGGYGPALNRFGGLGLREETVQKKKTIKKGTEKNLKMKGPSK